MLAIRRAARIRTPLNVRFNSSARDYAQTGASGMPPPLKGIKVLDLTRVLAGPTATMLLADLGADVIKVEEPTRGDDTRTWTPPQAPTPADPASDPAPHLPPESAYFLAVNRNKRSLTVDFKNPRGLEVLKRIVREADVLVENFVPGKLAKLGLGWETCREENPRLVYASITGARFPFARVFLLFRVS